MTTNNTKKTTITIAGSVCVFTSAHKKDELEKVAAYKPEALQLKDKDGNAFFCVLPGTYGEIKAGMLIYNDVAPDGSGRACLTMPLPTGDDAKKAVAAKYGPIIANANKVEAQVDEALTEVNTMLADVEGQIVIAGETPIEAE